jgi:5,5'-dehydrodivanillate O-demethylase
MRTPVDDTHTLAFHVTFTPFVNGLAPELPEGLTFDITDQLHAHRVQDYQAIISQGEIFDRTTEKLGRSDGGITIFRKMIMDGIETVRKGGDPKCVWRTEEMDRILDFSQDVIDDLMTKKAG